MTILAELRRKYHREVCDQIIRITPSKTGQGYPNFADGSSRGSTAIAWGIVKRLKCTLEYQPIRGQTIGKRFESLTRDFLAAAFEQLQHLRPGKWDYSTQQTNISDYAQYEHLAYLERVIKQDKNLASAFGGDYIVKPDIIVARYPISDEEINAHASLVELHEELAQYTPLRATNSSSPPLILHASISCKWTIRSDRAQSTRTEALNLIRNRKGNLAHIVAVTAEPLPTRIATLALGTGDLDCVYHFALPELQATIEEIDNEDQLDMLLNMIEGKRLRDISDLPFDLAI